MGESEIATRSLCIHNLLLKAGKKMKGKKYNQTDSTHKLVMAWWTLAFFWFSFLVFCTKKSNLCLIEWLQFLLRKKNLHLKYMYYTHLVVAVHIFAILSLYIKLKLIFIITLNVRFLLSNFCISYHFRKLLKSWMFISYFHRVFGPNFITFPAIFISSLLFFKYFRQILIFPHHVFFSGNCNLKWEIMIKEWRNNLK